MQRFSGNDKASVVGFLGSAFAAHCCLGASVLVGALGGGVL